MRNTVVVGLVIVLAGCTKAPTALMAHGKPVQHWLEALRDPDAKARRRAAEVLGNIGAVDPAVLAALTEAVKDRDGSVRTEVVLALMKMGPAARAAVPALEGVQKNDKDVRLRSYAAKALERIQGGP